VRHDDCFNDFKNKYTVPTLKQGKHRRIVKSKLGDFTLLTEFGIDCVDDLKTATTEPIKSSAAKIGLKKAVPFNEATSKLAFVKSGRLLKKKLIFRGKRSFLGYNRDQMLLSDIYYLLIGWYNFRSALLDVEKLSFKEVSERLEHWDTETRLGKLSCLLGELKAVAVKEDGVKFSAIFQPSADNLGFELKIFRASNQDKTEHLPEDILTDLKKTCS
jgi:hypothetical protein